MHENDIAKAIVDAAYKTHRGMGPGLLESVYEAVLAHEIEKAGLAVERQKAIPIQYEGLAFEEGFRADLMVGGSVRPYCDHPKGRYNGKSANPPTLSLHHTNPRSPEGAWRLRQSFKSIGYSEAAVGSSVMSSAGRLNDLTFCPAIEKLFWVFVLLSLFHKRSHLILDLRS